MKLLDLLNYVIVAVVLLAIGWVIKKAELWNYYHTISVPYLCSAIALSLLVVASTALVFQKPISEIPGMAVAIFCGVIIILMGVFIFINSFGNWNSRLFLTAILEWLGASAILVSAFVLPRLK
ncbi:MAG TPA: hypothetical protein VJC37_01290 [Planctomycetota bacterium]|nr:hypothetical protein [Planctomycetota bacterium]